MSTEREPHRSPRKAPNTVQGRSRPGERIDVTSDLADMMGTHISTSDLDIWTEQVGQGPDVLLIGGLGDTVESWQFQLDGLADRYRLTAFDNRGAGRTAMPDGPVSAELMADDAAQVLRALEVPSAHVAGFSMGSAIAQELAFRHPELVRSLVLMSIYARPDALFRSHLNFWRWLPEAAPSEQAFFEGADTLALL